MGNQEPLNLVEINISSSERVPGWLRRLEGPTGENERMKDGGEDGVSVDGET